MNVKPTLANLELHDNIYSVKGFNYAFKINHKGSLEIMKKSESKSTKKLVESTGAKKSPAVREKRAMEIAEKEQGARSAKGVSKGLVRKIVANEDKAGKTIKKSSVAKERKSKAASKYK